MRSSIIVVGCLLVAMSGCVGNQIAEVEPEAPEQQCGGPDEQRLRAFSTYLLPNVHSTGGGEETSVVFVNCIAAEIDYF